MQIHGKLYTLLFLLILTILKVESTKKKPHKWYKYGMGSRFAQFPNTYYYPYYPYYRSYEVGRSMQFTGLPQRMDSDVRRTFVSPSAPYDERTLKRETRSTDDQKPGDKPPNIGSPRADASAVQGIEMNQIEGQELYRANENPTCSCTSIDKLQGRYEAPYPYPYPTNAYQYPDRYSNCGIHNRPPIPYSAPYLTPNYPPSPYLRSAVVQNVDYAPEYMDPLEYNVPVMGQARSYYNPNEYYPSVEQLEPAYYEPLAQLPPKGATGRSLNNLGLFGNTGVFTPLGSLLTNRAFNSFRVGPTKLVSNRFGFSNNLL